MGISKYLGRKALLATIVAGAAVSAYAQTPKLTQVVSAASYKQDIAEGGFATAFGDFPITQDQCIPTTLPFPTELCGLKIMVDGAPAPLVYVGKGQANFFVPRKTGLKNVSAVVNGVESQKIQKDIYTAAPGIFRYGADAQRNISIAVMSDGNIMDMNRPIQMNVEDGQRYISLYGTGGGINPDVPVPVGTPVPTTELYPTTRPQFKIDGTPLSDGDILFSGHSPGFAGLWQYNLRLPRLDTGAHTLETCIQGKCDTVDLLVQGNDQRVLTGHLSQLSTTFKQDTFGATYNGQSFTTTPNGNFVLSNTTDGGTLVVDKALNDRYPVTTVEVKPGTTTLERSIPTFVEYPSVKLDYNPFAPTDNGAFEENQKFKPGSTPANNIMFLDWESSQGNGTINAMKWNKYPVQVYFDPSVRADLKEYILNNCATPWNTANQQISVIVDKEPEYGVIIRPPLAGEGNFVSFDNTQPVDFIQNVNSTIINKGRMILKLVQYALPEVACPVYTHELGHAVAPLPLHLPTLGNFLMSYQIASQYAHNTSAPPFEQKIASDYTLLNKDNNVREFSYTQSTSPISGVAQSAAAQFTQQYAPMMLNQSVQSTTARREAQRIFTMPDGSTARIVRQYNPAGSVESYFETLEVEKSPLRK